MKEIKDNTSRPRNIPCSWIGRINIVKISIQPKAIYRFNAIPISYQWYFLENQNKLFHNLYGNTKRTRIAKAILRKKNGTGEINQPDFRLYYKATAIKTVRYWHQDRNIDQ